MGAPALIDESWTVAAYFAFVALNDNVGSMISNDVVHSIFEAFNLSAFQQLSSFLDHPVNWHSTSTDQSSFLSSFFYNRHVFVFALFTYRLQYQRSASAVDVQF